jgi:hypothetical protein
VTQNIHKCVSSVVVRVCLTLGVLTAPLLAQESEDAVPQDLRFDVFRDDKTQPFGVHVIRFERTGANELTATTDVELKVSFGPFTVFRFETYGVGVWRSGELYAYESQTNDDGTKKALDMERQDGFYKVSEGVEDRIEAPVIPATHWNRATVNADRLMDAQDGEVFPIAVQPQGNSALVQGERSVQGERFTIKGKYDYDLYFDGERLIGARFFLEKATLTYLPSEPGEQVPS